MSATLPAVLVGVYLGCVLVARVGGIRMQVLIILPAGCLQCGFMPTQQTKSACCLQLMYVAWARLSHFWVHIIFEIYNVTLVWATPPPYPRASNPGHHFCMQPFLTLGTTQQEGIFSHISCF